MGSYGFSMFYNVCVCMHIHARVFAFFLPQLAFETGSLMEPEHATELQGFLCLCPWHCSTRFHLAVGDQAEGFIHAWVTGTLLTEPVSPDPRNVLVTTTVLNKELACGIYQSHRVLSVKVPMVSKS